MELITEQELLDAGYDLCAWSDAKDAKSGEKDLHFKQYLKPFKHGTICITFGKHKDVELKTSFELFIPEQEVALEPMTTDRLECLEMVLNQLNFYIKKD